MATKLAKLLADIVKRAGVNVEERKTIKAALENSSLAEIELDDAEALSILTNLHSKDSAKASFGSELVEQGRGEAYNAIKTLMEEQFADVLEADEIEALKGEKFATERVKKAAAIMQKKIKEGIKKADNKGDDETVNTLKGQLAKLNADLKKIREDADAEKATLTSRHKEELFRRDLISRVSRRNDILSDKLQGRHFAQNFMSDLDEYVAKKGIKINHDTGELLKADGTPYYTESNDKLELDDVLEKVVTDFGYKKKSDGGGSSTTVTVEEDDSDYNDVVAKNIARLNRGRK